MTTQIAERALCRSHASNRPAGGIDQGKLPGHAIAQRNSGCQCFAVRRPLRKFEIDQLAGQLARSGTIGGNQPDLLADIVQKTAVVLLVVVAAHDAHPGCGVLVRSLVLGIVWVEIAGVGQGSPVRAPRDPLIPPRCRASSVASPPAAGMMNIALPYRPGRKRRRRALHRATSGEMRPAW